MIFLSKSLITPNGAKILGSNVIDYNGRLLDYLKENYPHEMKHGTLSHSLLDRDNEYYLSYNKTLIYIYKVKPEEEDSLRSAVIANALQMSLELKHKNYEKKKER